MENYLPQAAKKKMMRFSIKKAAVLAPEAAIALPGKEAPSIAPLGLGVPSAGSGSRARRRRGQPASDAEQTAKNEASSAVETTSAEAAQKDVKPDENEGDAKARNEASMSAFGFGAFDAPEAVAAAARSSSDGPSGDDGFGAFDAPEAAAAARSSSGGGPSGDDGFGAFDAPEAAAARSSSGDGLSGDDGFGAFDAQLGASSHISNMWMPRLTMLGRLPGSQLSAHLDEGRRLTLPPGPRYAFTDGGSLAAPSLVVARFLASTSPYAVRSARYPISAKSALMAPSEHRELISLYAVASGDAANGRLLIFDVAAKNKLFEQPIAMPLDFWCWLKPQHGGETTAEEELTLALITPKAVAHWRVVGPNIVPKNGVTKPPSPAITMTRALTGTGPVLDYKCEQEWQLLVVAEGTTRVSVELQHAPSKRLGIWRGLAGALLVNGCLVLCAPLESGGMELRCQRLADLDLPSRGSANISALPLPPAPPQHCLAFPKLQKASIVRLVALRQAPTDKRHSLVALFWPEQQLLQVAKLPGPSENWELLLDTGIAALDTDSSWAEGTTVVGLTENTQEAGSLLGLLSSPSPSGSATSVCAVDFEQQNS